MNGPQFLGWPHLFLKETAWTARIAYRNTSSKAGTTGMKRHERSYPRLILAALIIVTNAVQGCVSIQVSSKDGKPKVIGFGHAKPVSGTGGQIYQIVAPGLSVRVHSYAPGLSLGWHETRLFYPLTNGQTSSPTQPVAVQNKSMGIDLTPTQFMLGYERSFAIAAPPAGANVIQFISYSQTNPTNTVIERKELR